MQLDDVIEQILRDGPVTLEAAFGRLVDVAPELAARGQPWLFEQVRKSSAVRLLPGARFELRDGGEPDTLLIEFPGGDEEAAPGTDSAEADASPRQRSAEAAAEPLGNAFVVIDIETNPDRADVREHEIIEVGACRVDDGRIIERFEVLVAPTRPLVDVVRDLTSLSDADLAHVVSPRAALLELLKFCGGAPLVAHNGFGYDYLVLDAVLDSNDLPHLPGERLDTLELAHVVAPRAGFDILENSDRSTPPRGRSLDELAKWLGVRNESREIHRALSDAELTVDVVGALIAELQSKSPTRELQRSILLAGGHPWSAWMEEPDETPELIEVIPTPERQPVSEADNEFDIAAAIAPLSLDGSLISGAARRHRPPQEEMARLVAGSLCTGSRLAVEAPTGTGKTLGYLVPSVAWAQSAGTPVLISTHSKVLQNQLLAAIADFEANVGPVNWVLLKGLENYVSLDRLEGAIDTGPVDSLEALGLAVVAGWVAQTPTGDWDDLHAWNLEARLPGFESLRWRLSIDSSPGPPTSRVDELCFFRRALEGLEVADIVILNHAVLVTRSGVLEAAEHVVIDEAHNLEESATNALSVELTAAMLDRLFRVVHDPEKRWGTLGRYVRATGKSTSDPKVEAVRQALSDCRAAAENLAPQIIDYVRNRSPVRRDEVEQFGVSYRIRRGLDTSRPDFGAVERSVRTLSTALVELAEALDGLEVPEVLRGRYTQRRLENEIARMGRRARLAVDTLTGFVTAKDDGPWISLIDLSITQTGWTWGVRRVPIDVSQELGDVWDSMRSVVLTSATLRVADSFEHIIGRLGLGAVQPKALPTTFTSLHDHELIVLPDHLPTPRGGLMDEFTIAEADELARLFLISSGRAMALFTAKSRMLHARDQVRPALAEHQLTVLCQGDEPSPALADRMRNERSTSLLATRSFWEGIDVPGEALSLLVIEKLPFASPADPIVAARMELTELKGRDPFSDYLVPEAVLRFVQGVGRLIRSENDIGACVLLDKRLRKPLPYREDFLRSLPGPPNFLRPITPMDGYEAIAEHLDLDLTPDMIADLEALPSADSWRQIEALQLSDDDITDEGLIDERLGQVRERFGFATWRPGQLEVMRRFIQGHDVLAILPTGTGKSLAFQIPALLRPGLTMVVSPLVALMRDQVDSLREKGMTHVAAVSSGQSQSEQEEILSRARHGAYKLLYVSPERLWTQRFRHALAGVNVTRVVVDEAHCIAQWGHSFRPEYLAIPDAIDAIVGGGARPPVLAATATATPEVQKEIELGLRLRLDDGVVSRDPDRPELRYYLQDCKDPDDRAVQLLRIVDSFRGKPAIVYVPSRAKATEHAALLRADNHVAQPYHGAMDAAPRVHVEEAFRAGEIDVVVATKAFGLGVDKPDVALVVHLEMPGSVEEYVQETGRAARGAIEGVGPKTGTCVLLRTPRDCWIHGMFIKSAAPEEGVTRRVWDQLRGREQFIPADQILDDPTVKADEVALAVHQLVQHDAVERLEDVTWEGRVWVPSDAEELYRSARELGVEFPTHAAAVVRDLSRRGSSDFHLMSWSERLDIEPARVEQILLELQRRDIIGFFGWRSAMHLRPKASASPNFGELKNLGEDRRRAVKALSRLAKDYRSNPRQCRRAFMLSYLGADAAPTCGACDVCRPDLPRPWLTSEITSDRLQHAVQAELVVLALLEDVELAGFSRSNTTRCLADSRGDFPLPERLAKHHLLGALSHLRFKGVDRVVEEMISGGTVDEVQLEGDDRTWTSLQRAKS